MFDTISVGSATLDVFLKSPEFVIGKNAEGEKILSAPYGGKIDVEEFALQSGGGGTNTAVAFARLGLRAGVVAEIGRDLPARLIKEELESEGVDLSLLVEEHDEATAVSALLISSVGGKSSLTGRGASRMLTVEDIPFAKLRANWIHISSVGNTEVVTQLARHCHKQHIPFSWNPGGAELQAIARGELHLHEVVPTLFCINGEEAALLEEAGYDLTTAGRTVVITEGGEGGRYYENRRWERYEPKRVNVVQETGAGDAFVAGMAVAYLHDRPTKTAIEWGKMSSTSVIQHMGAKTGLLRELPGV